MRARIPRQRGAIAVLVAVTIFVMLFAAGLVVDLGHLHIVKNELQNAADACALSGARELNDLSEGALDRITSAATVTGERNLAGLKSAAVDIPEANVTFAEDLANEFTRTITAATAYIRCQTATLTVDTWLMRIGGTQAVAVSAAAVARRAPGQTMCAIPLAICKRGGSALEYGRWYSGRMAAGTSVTGNYDWIRFPGMHGAADIADLLAGEGMCNVGPTVVDSQPGVAGGVAQAWNTRFGLYSGAFRDQQRSPPDGTGWAFTPIQVDNAGQPICPGGVPSGTWPPDRACALPSPSDPPPNAYNNPAWPALNFAHRHNVTHDPYDPNALLTSQGKPQVLPGSPAPLPQAQHATMSQDRRMVYVPVIDCDAWQPNGKNIAVIGYACALMLSPIDDPGTDVVLEFRGMMDDPHNNCGTTGFPGTAGAPVPALVR